VLTPHAAGSGQTIGTFRTTPTTVPTLNSGRASLPHPWVFDHNNPLHWGT